jgi:hypothetical protein
MRRLSQTLIAPFCLLAVTTVLHPGCGGGGSPSDDASTEIVVDAQAPGVDADVAESYTDNEDLPGPNGDPSLDAVGLDVGWLGNGTDAFAHIEVAGTWAPSDTFYSWYCVVELFNGGSSPVASATVQRHDGARSVFVTGLPEANVTIDEPAVGPQFLFESPPAFTHIRVELGIQKTNPGTRVSDEVEDGSGNPLLFPECP